jgi:SAM-dependent methyltransferase
MITDQELAHFNSKSLKFPDVIDLYRQHDFLTAYALHTDWRVRHNGYRAAVGNADDWERHGQVQFQFLKSQGLKPEHRLTEIGCGTGRLARKVVPYLQNGHYLGVDLSPLAIAAVKQLSEEEGWIAQRPLFMVSSVPPAHPAADYLWCFSVSVHLPVEEWRAVVLCAAAAMHDDSQFLFSYVPEKQEDRTGLKSFRHTLDTYRNACLDVGLTFEEVKTWMAEQHIARARLK